LTPQEFADAIRAYCSATQGSITSWGRTAKRNKAVGGVAESAHLLWIAADVVYDTPLDQAHRIALASRLGLKLIDEGDHDHLQGG